MNQEHIEILKTPDRSNLLHNTGGPRSRVRTEKVNMRLLESGGLVTGNERCRVALPPQTEDLERWALTMALNLNWSSLEVAAQKLKLPTVQHLVIPEPDHQLKGKQSQKERLRCALILSKCNKNYYMPESPMIFTRSRLERSVELVTINLDAYYELD
jgi:hypothetical protein